MLQGDLDGGEDAVEETLTEQMDRRLRIDKPREAPTAQQYMVPSSNAPAGMVPSNSMGYQAAAPAQEFRSKEELQNEEKKSADSEEDDSDFDSDFDDDLDDDGALEAFRQRRLAELKRTQMKEVENRAKGHGEVRTITQDEFLPECSGSSEFVTVHFFHDEFERCKLMDHHLKIIAPLHLSCKFVRINAEKAPFFIAKLAIKTLPTLLVFKDGKTIDRLMGFEGLSDSKNPDQFTTSRLGRWLESTGCIEYEGPDSDDEEGGSPSKAKRAGMLQSRFQSYDEEF